MTYQLTVYGSLTQTTSVEFTNYFAAGSIIYLFARPPPKRKQDNLF
jgi:hypothetical protein